MISVKVYYGEGIKDIYDKYLIEGISIVNNKCNEINNHDKYLKDIVSDNRYVVVCFFLDCEYIGFVVLITDEDERTLFIHKGWGSWESHEYIGDCLGILSHIAKRMGLAYMSFSSPRKAWIRVAGKYGFDVSAVVYKRKI